MLEGQLPDWLDAAKLPPIVVEDRVLPQECIGTILFTHLLSSIDGERELLRKVRAFADPRSLDAFALALFDQWHDSGADSEDRWVMTALRVFGGGWVCLRLEDQLPTWPAQSLYQRANLALECLEEINSEHSLTTLVHFAHLAKKVPWLRAVMPILSRLAEQRKQPMEQLLDFVPRFGMEQGACLQFEGQRFQLGLTRDMQPCLFDEKRRRLDEFPKAQSWPEPYAWQLARSEWVIFAQRVKTLLPLQRTRLERAMRDQRQWSAHDFWHDLATHPLLAPLVRGLVWVVMDGNKPTMTFRVGEGACVDLAGNRLTLPADSTIALAHPAMLPRDERLIWSDALAENDQTPPFVQLARKPFLVAKAEQAEIICERFLKRTLSGRAALAHLAAQGWTQHSAQNRVQKHFPISRQIACITFAQSVSVTTPASNPERVQVDECYITEVPLAKQLALPNLKHRMRLGEVDPVVFDEMLRVIEECLHL
jgi:hypothetical protein